MKGISLKVCGMKYPDNIGELSVVQPDYMGFIFYEKSPRYMGEQELQKSLQELPSGIKKTGVFVNSTTDQIKKEVLKYGLDFVQLHGDESPEQCQELKVFGIKVIKAFSVGEAFDFTKLEPYKASCDYFLFDTKSNAYGGTGKRFDWSLLKGYDNEIPFFLSGGIDEENIDDLIHLGDLNIHAVDINSRFEVEAGRKDIARIIRFKEKLQNILLDKYRTI